MDEKRLEEIRARVKAATPGPWSCSIDVHPDNVKDPYPPKVFTGWACGPDVEGKTYAEMRRQTDNDSDFIAHAREDVPDLLDTLEAALNELYFLKENN